MRSFAMAAAGLMLLAQAAQAQNEKAAPQGGSKELKTQQQKVSYILGMQIGRSLQRDGIDVDSTAFRQGMEDALGGKESQLSVEEMQAAMQAFQKQMQQKKAAEQKAAQEKRQQQAAVNKKKAREFLAANKQKMGVQELESGLQYKVLKEGSGKSPGQNATVKAHYRGTLIDGTVFDSSHKRDKPATLPINRVIKGWQEALPKMKVGGKWKLFVPPELAYGENPRPGSPIEPNELLIFEIELLDIVKEGKSGRKKLQLKPR